MSQTELLGLFSQYTGEKAQEIQKLSAAGSNRCYYRLSNARFRVIGVVGTSAEENEAFVYLAGHFKSKGLPVPDIHAFSEDRICYLQEDLGDELLFERIAEGRKNGTFNATERALLHKTIAYLPDFQYRGAEGLDFSRGYPLAEFNARSVFWDLNYFKYCFLKPSGLEFSEGMLENDFVRMADVLLEAPTDTFMYRDFQSRNVMLRDGEPFFIDFQGGRRGPVYYDVASFLWQARAHYPEELREELLDTYLAALRAYVPVEKDEFRKKLRHHVLFRMIQVLGVYGFRGYFERKPHFIQSVPAAMANLNVLLQQPFPEYPYLSQVLRELVALESARTESAKWEELEVSVCSFAYKNGIPEDGYGNGGGFVFDCRAIHNPGKYEPYKALTGMDEPVIRFLEEDGEILSFLEDAYRLVGASVKRYLERGFTGLTVCFGCTGGQHRSVYAAERLAAYLHDTFGVRIRLVHREQHIYKTFESER